MIAQESTLTVRGVRVRTLLVPMPRPLAVSIGQVTAAPLVLVDLETGGGPTGSAYIFAYSPFALAPVAQLVTSFGELIAGLQLAPLQIEAKLQARAHLLGTPGLVLMALSAIDMAAWDALAKAHELPLARLLGGAIRPIPAYNSNGLGIIGAQRAPQEARELLAPGFGAVKVRLGYPDGATDLAVARAVRSAVGSDVVLMSDFNQALSVAEATHRAQLLENEGLFWLEEPVAADDVRGHAEVRSKSRTAIQTGENWWGPRPMAEFIAQRACDYAMPDAGRIGGVTGWLRAAALADAARIPMSSHLYPEISAHLLAVTPTAHWLEYVDWAEPILQNGIRIENGKALAFEGPGSGIAWNEDAVAKFTVK